MDRNAIYVNCHVHGWVKVELYRGGEQIKFDNIAAVIRSMGLGYTFKHEPIPLFASGKFNTKRSSKKRYGQYNQESGSN